MPWSISHFVKTSGHGDIDIFYSSRHGVLIPLEEAGKVTEEIVTWCEKNADILLLIECYSRCGWRWDSNFCDSEDLQRLLEADWIDDNDSLKVDARLFMRGEDKHHNGRTETERPYIPVHGYVYVVRAPGMDPAVYKIGREREKFNRVDTLSIKLPWDLEIVMHIESDDYVALENELHERFKEKRVKGEWFQLNEADIEKIRKYALASKVHDA